MKNVICVRSDNVQICKLEIEDCVNCKRMGDRIRVDRLTSAELIETAAHSVDRVIELGSIMSELMEFSSSSKLGSAKKSAMFDLIMRIGNLCTDMDLDGSTILFNLEFNYLLANNAEDAVISKLGPLNALAMSESSKTSLAKIPSRLFCKE